MQFALSQIHDAHAKVKSTADFPQYVQTLKSLGVKSYSILLDQNETVYFDINKKCLSSKQNGEPFIIHDIVNNAAFKNQLSLHQQGDTDYGTFCRIVQNRESLDGL